MKKISGLFLCISIFLAGNKTYGQNSKQVEKSSTDSVKTSGPLFVPQPIKAQDTAVQESKLTPEGNSMDAQPEIKDKKYLTALRNLKQGKEDVNKLLGAELEKALPGKLNGWELSYSKEVEENTVNSMKSDPDLFYMVRVYTNKLKKIKYDTLKVEVRTPIMEGDTNPVKSNSPPNYFYRIVPKETIPQLVVIISNSSEYNDALTRIYDLTSDDPMQKLMYLSDPVKLTVKSNRAFYIFNKEAQSGDFVMSAGSAVLRITGTGISGPDIFENLANSINYEILNTVLR